MKKLSQILLATLLCVACDESDIIPNSKELEIVEIVDEQGETADDLFMIVEDMPSYPGGQKAWNKYLLKSLNYPKQAKELGIEGAVYTSFTVDKEGKLNDFRIARGIGGGCDEEALRVLMESENWNPGKQRGQVVNTRMQLRIVFKLDDSGSNGPARIMIESPTQEVIHEEESDIFAVVEETAQFEGGSSAFQNYLSSNLDYPNQAKKRGIEGVVTVSFVVNKDGEPSNLQVVRGIGAGCDEEALRLIKNTTWEPGKQGGRAVNSRMHIRVPFRMTNP